MTRRGHIKLALTMVSGSLVLLAALVWLYVNGISWTATTGRFKSFQVGQTRLETLGVLDKIYNIRWVNAGNVWPDQGYETVDIQGIVDEAGLLDEQSKKEWVILKEFDEWEFGDPEGPGVFHLQFDGDSLVRIQWQYFFWAK